jgi:hypothetical protein
VAENDASRDVSRQAVSQAVTVRLTDKAGNTESEQVSVTLRG